MKELRRDDIESSLLNIIKSIARSLAPVILHIKQAPLGILLPDDRY